MVKEDCLTREEMNLLWAAVENGRDSGMFMMLAREEYGINTEDEVERQLDDILVKVMRCKCAYTVLTGDEVRYIQ